MLNAVRPAPRHLPLQSTKRCPFPHASSIPDRLSRLPFPTTLPLITYALLVYGTFYLIVRQTASWIFTGTTEKTLVSRTVLWCIIYTCREYNMRLPIYSRLWAEAPSSWCADMWPICIYKRPENICEVKMTRNKLRTKCVDAFLRYKQKMLSQDVLWNLYMTLLLWTKSIKV